MPFVPVPNTALAELRYTANGQKVENTLWFEMVSNPSSEDLVALATDLYAWWVANIQAKQSALVQLREIVCTSMSSDSAPTGTFSPATAAMGGNTTNIVPNSVTLAITFRTGVRGRSFRGRNYIIGMTEDQIAGNQVVTGLSAPWAAAYNALQAAVDPAIWTWVVVSRFLGKDPVTGHPLPRGVGITTPVIAAVVGDDNIDSQRRRLTGRGQ